MNLCSPIFFQIFVKKVAFFICFEQSLKVPGWSRFAPFPCKIQKISGGASPPKTPLQFFLKTNLLFFGGKSTVTQIWQVGSAYILQKKNIFIFIYLHLNHLNHNLTLNLVDRVQKMLLQAFKKVVTRQYFSRNFFPGKSGSQKNFENEYFLQVCMNLGGVSTFSEAIWSSVKIRWGVSHMVLEMCVFFF